MTHATIELLNAMPGDRITIDRTPTGLTIRHTSSRGHRVGPGRTETRTKSIDISRDALDRPYDGFDPLGAALAELRDSVDPVSA